MGVLKSLKMELVAELESGQTIQVVADSRDFAKWEVQDFGGPIEHMADRALTMMRFLAWSAARRQQLTVLSWSKWDEACITAEPVDDEDEDQGDEQGPASPADADHPGRPGQ